MARVILVVPCYNEESRLDHEALVGFQLEGHQLDLCLVDDGSTDATAALLARIAAKRPGESSVLCVSPNGGKAEAVRRGMVAALEQGADFVGFWDADLATPLNELPEFLAVLEARPEVQLVMGARVKLLGRTIERRPLRHYLGRVFATTVSLVLRLPVYDTQCGAKLFRASSALGALFAERFLSRWIFDVEIIARLRLQAQTDRNASPLAARIYELPLGTWRDVGGSKLKSTDFFKAMLELWRIHVHYR